MRESSKMICQASAFTESQEYHNYDLYIFIFHLMSRSTPLLVLCPHEHEEVGHSYLSSLLKPKFRVDFNILQNEKTRICNYKIKRKRDDATLTPSSSFPPKKPRSRVTDDTISSLSLDQRMSFHWSGATRFSRISPPRPVRETLSWGSIQQVLHKHQ